MNTDSEKMFALDVKAHPETSKNVAGKIHNSIYNDYVDSTNIQINKSARNKNNSKTKKPIHKRFGRVMALN